MLKKVLHYKCVRYFNTTKAIFSDDYKNVNNFSNKMKAWHIHSYGGLNNLEFSNIRSPFLNNPDEILVEVHASSVNPIDIAIIGGYGCEIFNSFRKLRECSLSNTIEFPLILGRDFSGKILAKGMNVSHYNEGDLVWGVLSPMNQGCHAEQVIVHKDSVSTMPENLNHIEAASLLYAGLTAWSSLKISGDLCFSNAYNKNVLVLGGSGGVGSIAVQLLKAWEAKVTSTCNADAKYLLESLCVDHVLDYCDPNFKEELNRIGKFDIILDCAGLGSDAISEYGKYLKEWNFSKFITLKSPLLKNCDDYGLFQGMTKNLFELFSNNLNVLNSTSTVRWAYFIATQTAIQELSSLVKSGKLKPLIQDVYSFSNLPEAYLRVSDGHLRGKIVIDMKKENEN